MLAPTVLGTSPGLEGGSLSAGTNWLELQFSEPVVGAVNPDNYELWSAGADALLDTSDDVLYPLTLQYVSVSGPDQIYDSGGGLPKVSLDGNPLRGLVVADFNVDDKTDFAVTHLRSNNVVIHFGDGMGGFGATQSFSAVGGAMTTGDFNLDGWPDLAIISSTSHGYNANVAVLLADRLGGFETTNYVPGGLYPRGVTVGDFNDDGYQDLAIANFGTGTVGVLLNDRTGHFATAVPYSSGGCGPLTLAVGDFGGDPKPDLIVANNRKAFSGGPTEWSCEADSGDDNVAVLVNDGSGQFGAPVVFDSGGDSPTSIAVEDFNGDSHQDLAITNSGNYDNNGHVSGTNLAVLLGKGNADFYAPQTYDTGGRGSSFAVIGHFNDDQTPDVAVATRSENVAVLLGDGTGGFGTPALYESGPNPELVAVGNFNGTGTLDLVVGNTPMATVGVFLDDGVGMAVAISFSGLSQGAYRLTIKDTIVGRTGSALDGDRDDVPGGNWAHDFVVDSTRWTAREVHNINPLEDSVAGARTEFYDWNGVAAFVADDGAGPQIWTTTGTGAVKVAFDGKIWSRLWLAGVSGDYLFFKGDDGSTYGWWRAARSTGALQYLNTDADLQSSEMAFVDGTMYCVQCPGEGSVASVWAFDGETSSLLGYGAIVEQTPCFIAAYNGIVSAFPGGSFQTTYSEYDIESRSFTSQLYGDNLGLSPDASAMVGETVFYHSTHGWVWVPDEQAPRRVWWAGSGGDRTWTEMNGRVYGTDGGLIWSADETAGIPTTEPFSNRRDATPGVRLVYQILSGRIEWNGGLVNASGTLMFSVRNLWLNRLELWKSDGQAAELVKVVQSGASPAWMISAVNVNGLLYFVVVDDPYTTPRTTLWVSDGTDAGTFPVSGAAVSLPNLQWYGPDALASVGGKLYFVGNDEVHGSEPWVVFPPGPAPTADAGGPYTVEEGKTLQLGQASASDADQPLDKPLVYEWDLDGDGVLGETGPDAQAGDETGEQPFMTPTFSAANLWVDGDLVRTIRLRVTDEDGQKSLVTTTVTVLDRLPIVDFDWSPRPAVEGSPVSFSDLSTIDRVVSWNWDVQKSDNGERLYTSAAQNPTFTFPDNETYDVTLSVSDTLGNGPSERASISSNGRYVAFVSSVNNLVVGDTNGARDVFVRDLQTRGVTRVSVASDGSERSGNADLPLGAISDNGQFVLIASVDAYVSDDTNGTWDIYRRDLWTSETKLVSVNNDGTAMGVIEFQFGPRAALSRDGSYVAFVSSANDAAMGDDNNQPDVFVRHLPLDDNEDGTTERASVATDGRDLAGGAESYVSVSDNGVVVFSSTAKLVAADTNEYRDVYARDVLRKTTELVSVSSTGVLGDADSDDGSYYLGVSSDGCRVAFQSRADSLYPDFGDGSLDVFVRDLCVQPHTTTVVNVPDHGSRVGEAWFDSISRDGRYILFESDADNLTSAQDNNGAWDVFMRYLPRPGDPGMTTTTRVTLGSNGAEPNADSWPGTVSADGRYVAFDSGADNLVLPGGDTNGFADVFLRDLASASTLLVSAPGVSKTLSVVVQNAPPVVNAGPEQNVDEGVEMSFAGSFSDAGVKDTHTLLWNFGDGNSASGTLTPKHTYLDNGTYTVTLTVTDNANESTSDQLVVTVNDLSPTANFTWTPHTQDEGSKVDFSDGSTSFPDTITTRRWDFAGVPRFEDDPSYPFPNDGVLQVTLTVTDEDGSWDDYSAMVTIRNVPPSMAPIVDVTNASVAVPVEFSTAFTDPGTGDVHTVQIDWGDNTVESGVVVESNGSGTASGSHTYGAAGVYEVKVTLSDGSAALEDRFLVAVDSPVVTLPEGTTQADIYADAFHYGDGVHLAVYLTPTATRIDCGKLIEKRGLLVYGRSQLERFVANVTGLTSGALSTGIWLVAGEGSEVAPNGDLLKLFDPGPPYIEITNYQYKTGGPESGTITMDQLTVHFFEFEPIEDNLKVANRTFLVGTPDDVAMRLSDEGTGSERVSTIEDPITHAFEGLTFLNPDESQFTIEGGAGNTAIDVSDTSHAVTLSAGTGQTTVITRVGNPVTINEGDHFMLHVAEFGEDPAQMLIDWGDGSTSTPDATLKAGHRFVDDGQYEVKVTVGGQLVATTSVTARNVAPLVSAGLDWTISEGSEIRAAGSFHDPGADTWEATVDYGDGSGIQPLALAEDKSFLLNHTYADNGTFTVTVRVTDDDNAAGVDTLSVFVRNVPPVVAAGANASIVEGSTFAGTGSFVDPGADSWEATVDYGDGSGVQALTLNADKTFSLSHVYGDNGNYTVTVRVHDDDMPVGTWSEGKLTVTVKNVLPSVEAGLGAMIEEGTTFRGSGAFTDPGADIWTATVDYGDGSGVRALALSGKTFNLSHVYADNGSYTVTVVVTDDELGAGSDTAVVTVNNVAPTVDAGGDATIDEGGTFTSSGSFTDPGVDSWTATVDYGDGSGVQALALSGKMFNLSHVYADNGSYTVTVRVRDDDMPVGTWTEDNLTVTVNNVAPSVNAGPDQTVAEGDVVLLNGHFTDPGEADMHTIRWDVVRSDGQWMAGKTHSVDTDFSVTLIDEGTYVATFRVTDDDGGWASDELVITVDNVAPQLRPLSLSEAAIDETEAVTLSGAFDDPGYLDEHSVSVDWGDGTNQTVPLNTPVTFSDSSFDLDEWVLYFVPYGGGGTVEVTQANSSDGSGTFLQVDTWLNPTSPVGYSQAGVFAIKPATVYDPSIQGAIREVEFRMDGAPLVLPASVFELSGRFAVRQDGEWYVTSHFAPKTPGPTRVYTAADFCREGSTTIHPDFSTNGGPIELGLLTSALMLNQSESAFVSVAFDNWSVAIRPFGFSATHQYLDDGEYLIQTTVSDGDGGTDVGTASLAVQNVPPVAGDDQATLDEDTQVSINVLANDTDAAGDRDPLAIVALGTPLHGTAVLDDRGTSDTTDDVIVYSPHANYAGADSFTYTISDGDGGTATAVVAITASPINDAPDLANPGNQFLPVGGTLSFTLTATDPDVVAGVPDATSYSIVSGVQVGMNVDAVTGVFSWTPPTYQAGSYTVTFRATDPYGLYDEESIVITSGYQFGGFLPPLSNSLSFALGRTIPVKFQLRDAAGNLVSDLSAVTGIRFAMAGSNSWTACTATGGTGWRYETPDNQYVFNWKTKGQVNVAGDYTLVVDLKDGTHPSKDLIFSKNGGAAKLTADSSGTADAMGGALLAGDVALLVDNSGSQLAPEELSRIQAAVTSINQVVAPYGVTIYEIDASRIAEANVTVGVGASTVAGGLAEGVLGVAEGGGLITLVLGWNWFSGSDTWQIAADQYDFQTIVTHEIGHALGLGHSESSTSVMYAMLSPGVAHRALTAEDLNVADDGSGTSALRVASVRPVAAGVDAALAVEYGRRAAANVDRGFWETQRFDRAVDRVSRRRSQGLVDSFGSDASVWPWAAARPLVARDASRIDYTAVAYARHLYDAAAVDTVFGFEGEDLSAQTRADGELLLGKTAQLRVSARDMQVLCRDV